jgi:hypothetical protein
MFAEMMYETGSCPFSDTRGLIDIGVCDIQLPCEVTLPPGIATQLQFEEHSGERPLSLA